MQLLEQFISSSLATIVVSILTGSGLGWWVAKTAVKAAIREIISEDLARISNESVQRYNELSRRLGRVEKEYVTCDYCRTQNEHTTQMFKSIDDKLNIILDHSMR